jgi:hypothetical protein
VSYRDDVDSLYMRASALQRELDRAQSELARRDAELAALRGPPIVREWPNASPLPLRELPAAETTLAQLIDTFTPRGLPLPPPTPPAPREPEWLSGYRAKLLEATRDRLGELGPESLVLVGAIIEELAMEPSHRTKLLDQLRPIVREIAGNHS